MAPGLLFAFSNSSINALPTITASAYSLIFFTWEGFDIPNINVFDCWINWYGKNEFAVPHHHGLNIAFVYFVDVEDTDASFLFHNRTSMSFKKKQENGEYRNDIKNCFTFSYYRIYYI